MLEIIFGNSGEGMAIFGGLAYLMAFFILGFFILMLFSQRVSGEDTVFFVFAFLLLLMFEGLFSMPTEIVITVIILLVLFVALYAYKIFNQGD